MESTLTPLAEAVGYASLLPLLLCLLGVGLLPGYHERELAQQVALAYGSVMLAFGGAVHWGLALVGRLPWSALRITGAVLPALAAVVAMVLSGQRGLAVLAVGTGVFWLYEHRSLGSALPPAYLSLRRSLSVAACALLAVTLILSDNAGLR